MRYFVLEIETVNGATSSLITEKATEDEAKALFHQILSSAYANPNLTYAICQIIDERGYCLVMEKIPSIIED